MEDSESTPRPDASTTTDDRDAVVREVNGALRIAGTRITIDTVIAEIRNGRDPEWISEGYPSLSPAVIVEVMQYYIRNREAVDQYLREGKEELETLMREHPEIFATERLWERLMERKRQSE